MLLSASNWVVNAVYNGGVEVTGRRVAEPSAQMGISGLTLALDNGQMIRIRITITEHGESELGDRFGRL